MKLYSSTYRTHMTITRWIKPAALHRWAGELRELISASGRLIKQHKLRSVTDQHLLRVLPPLLPLVGVVCRDGQVADRSVEPHVEHLGGQTDEVRIMDNISEITSECAFIPSPCNPGAARASPTAGHAWCSAASGRHGATSAWCAARSPSSRRSRWTCRATAPARPPAITNTLRLSWREDADVKNTSHSCDLTFGRFRNRCLEERITGVSLHTLHCGFYRRDNMIVKYTPHHQHALLWKKFIQHGWHL